MTSGEPAGHTVLVVSASRHGATAGIAARIAGKLSESLPTWSVLVEDSAEVDSVDDYDAVVLGSAIYLGRWLKSARQLLENTEAAPPLGMWLFSSGPVSAAAPGIETEATNEGVAARLRIKDNVVFAGSLDLDTLGLAERAVTSAMRIAGGDFRDWEAIDSWASGIARELSAASSDSPHRP